MFNGSFCFHLFSAIICCALYSSGNGSVLLLWEKMLGLGLEGGWNSLKMEWLHCILCRLTPLCLVHLWLLPMLTWTLWEMNQDHALPAMQNFRWRLWSIVWQSLWQLRTYCWHHRGESTACEIAYDINTLGSFSSILKQYRSGLLSHIVLVDRSHKNTSFGQNCIQLCLVLHDLSFHTVTQQSLFVLNREYTNLTFLLICLLFF